MDPASAAAPYGYSPIIDRPRVTWPGDARLAVWVAINLEVFLPGGRATSLVPRAATALVDPLNTGWRDYGPRVGFWRIYEALQELGFPGSAMLNSEVIQHYPQIVEAGLRADWAWIAHGTNNSSYHDELQSEAEAEVLASMTDAITAATGNAPTGWLGPGLSESPSTLPLLRSLGYTYVLDWCCDDQPFETSVPGMYSVPYTLELNDIVAFSVHHLSASEYGRAIKDQFDVLMEESAETGRVLTISLHPFLAGHAFRIKHIRSALEYIASSSDVWLTTSDDLARHFASAVVPTSEEESR